MSAGFGSGTKAYATAATTAGIAAPEEWLFGQRGVKLAAEEALANLPEGKLALLTIGFLAGGGVALWLKGRHTAQLAEERQHADARSR